MGKGGTKASGWAFVVASMLLSPSVSGASRKHEPGARWRHPWPVLLLTGHVLSYCFSPTAAENATVFVSADPWFPVVGTGVTLVPRGGMSNFSTCSWYRWEISQPSQILVYEPPTAKVEYKKTYTGRETVRKDCSLHIRNLSMTDISYFFILKNSTDSTEVGYVFLVVTDGLKRERKAKGLSKGAVAGIFLVCFILATAVAIMASYKIITSSTGEKTSPPS